MDKRLRHTHLQHSLSLIKDFPIMFLHQDDGDSVSRGRKGRVQAEVLSVKCLKVAEMAEKPCRC